MVFKCVATTAFTRASFSASLSLSDATQSPAFFSVSASDLAFASDAAGAGWVCAPTERAANSVARKAIKGWVFIASATIGLFSQKNYSAGENLFNAICDMQHAIC